MVQSNGEISAAKKKGKGRSRSASIWNYRNNGQHGSLSKDRQSLMAEQRAAAEDRLQKSINKIMALEEHEIESEAEKTYVSVVFCFASTLRFQRLVL